MRIGLLIILSSIALIGAGPVVSSANETGASAHHKRIAQRQNVAHSGSDITSFSSSSALHVGVNHPPKNR